jgi:hypothetical protein
MLTATLDLSELHRKIEQTKVAARRDLAIATRQAADAGVAAAKTGRFKDRSGQLRATINTTALGWRGQTFWMQVVAPMPYAHFVDFGTAPHDIPQPARPPGKPLHFYWEKRGIWFTGYGVHHPGTHGSFFFAGAVVIMEARLYAELSKGFANVRSVWN